MIITILHPRVLENKDWAIILFFVAFGLVALVKTFFEKRFSEFFRLFVSDKYVKIYRDSSNLMTSFSVILFLINLISLSFFLQLTAVHFNAVVDSKIILKTDWVFFIRIFTFLGVFILSKFLLEKIISTLFGVEEIIEQINLQKVTYKTYFGLLLLPICFFLYFNDSIENFVFYSIIVSLITLNVVSYLIFLKNYQNLIFGKLFYFILYLCALEIAPYYFIYYLIKNS